MRVYDVLVHEKKKTFQKSNNNSSKY